MVLTRDAILGMSPPKETVAVPEWGGSITITAMSIVQRLDYERWAASLGGESVDAIVGILAFTIVDEAGQPLFTLADLKALEAQSAAVIIRLNKIALRLNELEVEVNAAKGES
jgi:hypothetical protein